MKVALAATLASVAIAFRPASIYRPVAPASSKFLPATGNFRPSAATIRTQASGTLTTMSASAEDEEQSGSPFTRRSFLEGATKAAGVLGAGMFVHTNFVAGVPYHGKPDLSGKVRHLRMRWGQ